MEKTQTRPWDPAEHLETEQDMAAYLNVALEEGDLSLIMATLGDIARARRMAIVAEETGLGRESLYKSLSRRRQPGVRHRAQGGARPGTPASRDRSARSNRRTGYPVFGSALGVVADLNRRTLDGVWFHYAMEVNVKMVRLVFAIAVLMSFCLSCIGGPEVVRMGTEGAYPPYNFINDKGEVDGFERELGDELCRRADLECVWVTNEWDSIIPNLAEGKYDTIMAGMSITDERDEVIDFTQPYIPPSPSVYVARAGASDEAVAGRVAAPGGHHPGGLPVGVRRNAGGVRVGRRCLFGRPEGRGGCDAGRYRVRPRVHDEERRGTGNRRSPGHARRRYRHRRPGVRRRVERQAGPGHRHHETGRLVERPHRGSGSALTPRRSEGRRSWSAWRNAGVDGRPLAVYSFPCPGSRHDCLLSV